MNGIRITPDRVHPAHFESADGVVSKLPQEQKDRYNCALGFKDGQSARASGLERDARRADEELIEIESEENTRHAILRVQNATMGDEERERFAGKKERKQRQIDALRSASAEASKEAGGARDVAHRVVLYLSGVAADGGVLTPKTVKLGRGPYEDQLAVNREEQRKLGREYERIRNAGTPIEAFKQQVLHALDERQGRDPFALTYFDGRATLKEPAREIDAASANPGHIVTAPDPMPMMLALFGDEIRARVLARIDRDHEGDDSLRIEASEKRRLLADLRARILELQYVEGALLAAIAGPEALEIPFRKGMDPRAVIGVSGPAPKAV